MFRSRSIHPRIQVFLCSLLACMALPPASLLAAPAVALHPENPHYFEFRGRPIVLVGSSEHYGALIHLDFDYLRYLDETRACGLNLVRIFTGTYLENDGAFGITENTLAPEAGRFLAPWKRSTTPGAADGGNKFDLNQWNPAYFYRLRDLVAAAAERDIVVEVTLFGAMYDDTLWQLSPMNSANHVNGAGSGGRAACFSVNSNLLPYQRALAAKCAVELRNFDNVILEICNEPYQQNIPLAWEHAIVNEIVTTQSGFPQQHLIALNVFNYQGNITSPHPKVSIFNFHYANPAAVTQNFSLNRALGDDETGNAGREDFTYRREAWEFMMSGGSLFNHLDFSFTTTREDGISAASAPGGGGPAIRRQLGILRWFLESMPLVRMVPQAGLVTSGIPSGGTAIALGSPGEAYGIYLRGGTQSNLVLNLPAGTYRGEWIDPRSGAAASVIATFTHGGGTRSFPSPTYLEDIGLRLFGGTLPPPRVTLTKPAYNSVIASTQVTLEAQASVENGTLQGIEFLDGNTSLGVVTGPPYQITITKTWRGSHVFRARAIASGGRSSHTPPQKVWVSGPFHAGVNLNGPSVTVDGVALLSQSDAETAGFSVSNAQALSGSGNMQVYPSPDGATTLVLSDQFQRVGTNAGVTMGFEYPVPNGHYDIYLFIVEDQIGYSRDMSFFMENQLVASGIGSLALDEWHKYGPYRAAVTDGALNLGLLRDTKGTPKIAAFSIYQATAPPSFADIGLNLFVTNGVAVLSHPSGLQNITVEAADHPSGNWEELTDPVSKFLDYDVIPVEVDRPKRFFRLREN